jgi:3,4-dihydroxy 2-butanone 4-phosphate synthase/GTP cyclohydrolase II
LEKFAQEFGLKLVTIADLIQYRLRYDCLVYEVASARLPTRLGGEFQATVYNTHVDDTEHLALVKGKISPDEETLVRMHSKFVPGDVFGFDLLNSGAVIHYSMKKMAQEGKGVIVYLQTRENRLTPALAASQPDREQRGQKSPLVRQSDFRDYGIGAQILRQLGVGKMRLLTNNPKNLVGLSGYGLEITASVPLELEPARAETPTKTQAKLKSI